MHATPSEQARLLQLQQLDTQLARTAHQRSQLPERAAIAGLGAESTAIRGRFMAAQRSVEECTTEQERLASDVATVTQRRARNEQRLAASTSAKEASSLQDEIDSLHRRAGDLEEMELSVLERVETAQAALDAVKADLAGLNERREALEASLVAEEARLDSERARLAEDRKNLSVEIAGNLLALYEETRAENGIGAARLRGRVSEGSNMALTDSELAQIRETSPNEIVFCPGSGAILIRGQDEE